MGNIPGLGLQKYHVSKTILGKGAFGTVEKATNKYTNESVAIKTMLKSSRNYHEDIVFEEIKIGRRLQHPNLCRFIEYFNRFDAMILVLEYCTDGDLTDRIKQKGSDITQRDAQEWMYQILMGLKFMHSEDICHRDLKPDNCMFTNDFQVLKLCDFGIAAIVPKGELLTQKCGTVAFMSPEQMRGKYSLPCDVWAVGCIMYTILNNNRHPFIKGDEKNQSIKKDDQLAGNVKFLKDSWTNRAFKNMLDKTATKHRDAAQELCDKMCTPDPRSRPTAVECLDSKWLEGIRPELDKQFESLLAKQPQPNACSVCGF